MTGSRHLRDARHVEKFIFTLSDGLFYEPYEAHYEPSREYLDLVTKILGDSQDEWAVAREGLWFHAHPRTYRLPVQGWKVHVSAVPSISSSILGKTATVALARSVPFKFALDKTILSMMGSKSWHRGGSGKFITLYPGDRSDFESLLDALYEALKREHGPYILSDRRYRDCRVLYYRFGGIERKTELDVMGRKNPVLISPDGVRVPDVRTPYFTLPAWVDDPFPAPESSNRELTLKDGRYLIKRALAFSNTGGVYLADDREAGSVVVVKEARAHTAVDDRGNDAIRRLEKERDILALLQDTGIVPRPIDSFRDWENFFLVEEYVSGVDVRELMLKHGPLLRVNPTLADTDEYYGVFRKVIGSFADALGTLHERGVVLGDLSASNIKVDPSTYAVRLIDFEGAFRPGVDEPTFLYTPGFKAPSSVRNRTQTPADDLYSLAAVALYMLFPIAALSALREDLYGTVLRSLLADAGWSETEVFRVVSGLADGSMSCARAVELLSRSAQVSPPVFGDDIETGLGDATATELGDFILSSMRTESGVGLFPGDPFMYQTNTLGLGFGACGVLYSLRKCGFEIPAAAFDRLERELDRVDHDAMPPGILTGAAGIAWTLFELGFEDRAADFARMANESRLLRQHHSYFYGIAGVGMVDLFLHLRTGHPDYLELASALADQLLDTARESERGVYWESDKVVHLGYGYGQSGVALFLLRLAEITGRDALKSVGRRALEFDLSHGVEAESGVLSFPISPGDSTLLPYLEAGSAGIAKVAIRYGMWDVLDRILSDVHRKYAGSAGLLFGLGGFIDVLTDAFLYSGDVRYLEMAKRPLAGLRDIYIIGQSVGSATPGEGLFRISCDYGTGVAGVLRAVFRHAHPDLADFTLDEVRSPVQEGQAG